MTQTYLLTTASGNQQHALTTASGHQSHALTTASGYQPHALTSALNTKHMHCIKHPCKTLQTRHLQFQIYVMTNGVLILFI